MRLSSTPCRKCRRVRRTQVMSSGRSRSASGRGWTPHSRELLLFGAGLALAAKARVLLAVPLGARTPRSGRARGLFQHLSRAARALHRTRQASRQWRLRRRDMGAVDAVTGAGFRHAAPRRSSRAVALGGFVDAQRNLRHRNRPNRTTRSLKPHLDAYLGGRDPSSPAVAPLYANLTGLPITDNTIKRQNKGARKRMARWIELHGGYEWSQPSSAAGFAT